MKTGIGLFLISALAALTPSVPARAITLLEPGYRAQTYATYSEPEIGDTRGMVFDSGGNLYATHGRPNGFVWRITPEGVASEFLSGLGATCGIVWGGGTEYGDCLYVVEYETWGGAIHKISVDGAHAHFASMDRPLHAPTSLNLDKTGNYGGYLYIGTSAVDHIYRVDTDGAITMFSDFPGWTDGGAPYDIAFDPGTDYGGLMYVATKFGYTPEVSGLFALDREGRARRFAPELAGALRAKFDQYGMFWGQLFIIGWTDLDQPSALWKVGPDGTATKFAETTASRGLAFGPDEAMYVAEYSPDDCLMTISRIYREVSPATYYVDTENGSDLNDGLSPQTAFATIQRGIDSAGNGDTVLVYPGTYTEKMNFLGKAIAVRGVAGAAGVPVLEGLDGFAVSFCRGEGPDSILKNFIIRNSFTAVLIVSSYPTISNVTIVDNEYGISAYAGLESNINNSIFWNNVRGDLFGCQASYSWVQEEIELGLPEGLVSHWSFDEGSGTTVFDSIGDRHGTVYGAEWTAGQVNSALSFDGVDDYVDCGNSGDLRILGDMSVGLWFKRALTSAFKPTLIVIEGGAFVETEVENAVFYLRLLSADTSEADVRYIHEYGPGWNEYYDFDTDIPPGVWTHVVVVRDTNARTVKIYENAVLEETFYYSVNPTTTNEQPKLTIGSRHSGVDNFEGSIDEVAIYGRILSAEEIRQLYESGLNGGGFVAEPLFADPANGDYHLLSERGRYWPEHDVWVLDEVTSPCIDGGDPDADYSNEPLPNGGSINMGAYGGTSYASMSETKWLDPDVNGDGVVDISDVVELLEQWLDAAGW